MQAKILYAGSEDWPQAALTRRRHCKHRRTPYVGDHGVDDYSVHRADIDSADVKNPALSNGYSVDYTNIESTGDSSPPMSDTRSVASASITVEAVSYFLVLLIILVSGLTPRLG